MSETNFEIFDSALVARFFQESNTVTKYRVVPHVGLKPDGEAKLVFQGVGSMLEAQRLGDDHIEVTKSDSVRDGVPILLVATRKAIGSMKLDDWEMGWRDRPENSQIKREITWWELTNRGKLRVHPVVESFDSLARQVEDSLTRRIERRPAAEPEISWERALERA